MTADAVSYHLRNSIKWIEADIGENPLKNAAIAYSASSVLFTHYALLYVVIEGYRELQFSDETIDSLLKDTENLKLLRHFRNGAFHYQKEPISRKTLEFLVTKNSETWIKKLHNSFDKFFVRELNLEKIIKDLKLDPHKVLQT